MAKAIKIITDDGDEIELKKGAAFYFSDSDQAPSDGEECTINTEFIGMSGEDFCMFVYAVVKIGMKLGMFGEVGGE